MAYDGTLKFNTKIDIGDFQKGIASIGEIAAKGIQATAKIMTAVAAGIGTIGAAAIKVGSDFEAAMSKVEAISGATGEDLAALKEKAKEMGASTKFSATESANAFEYMAMAGWKTADMLNGIEGIMNLAAASGEDLASTSDIVTDAMTAFGLAADKTTTVVKDGFSKEVPNASHFADILAQASSNANTNVSMLGETFKYVAPVAGALGYTAEDTAAAIGLMANAGIKGSQAGTSLRSMMSRLAKPTKEVQGAMDALGITLTNSDGSMKSLAEIMVDLREGFDGLSEAEAAEMASSLAGQEAMSGLLAIVGASEEDFNKLQSSIYNCDGAAAQMAETMNDNLQGQLTILKSGLEGLGISLYENMQAPMKDIVVEVQGMVQQLQEAFDNGGLEGLVTKAGEVFSQIVERAAGTAPDLIDAAAQLISSFCDSLKNSPGIGDAAASLITSLVTALLHCSGELWSTAITLVGKMAEGLAAGAPEMTHAAVSCIADTLKSLQNCLPDLVSAGMEILGSLITGAGEDLPELIPLAVDCILMIVEGLIGNADLLLNGALSLILGLAEGLIQAVPLLIDCIPEIIAKLGDALARYYPKLIETGIKLVVMLAKGLLQAVPQLIRAVPKIISAWLGSFGKVAESLRTMAAQWLAALAEELQNRWAEVKDCCEEKISEIIEDVETWFSELPGRVLEAVISVRDSFIQWGEEVIAVASNAARSVVEGVIGFFSGLPERIAYWLGYAAGTFIQWGIDLAAWAVTEIPKIIASIVTFFSELPGRVSAWLKNTVNQVIQWGADMLSSAGTAAQGAVDAVTGWFQQLPGKVWTWLTNVITKVLQFSSNLQAKAAAAGQGFFTRLVNGVKDLPNKFKEIGSDIVTGIWNGITSGWNWLMDKVKGLVGNLVQGAKDALDINSPSKVFRREVGRWIPPGIGEGVEDAMPQLQRRMDAEMDELVRKMQTAVAIETGGITVRTRAKAEHAADTEYPRAGGDTYIDQHVEQENNYHVPVASPSEVNKANRKAVRDLLGGVK